MASFPCDPCCGDPGSCCGGSGSASNPGCAAMQSGIPGHTLECTSTSPDCDPLVGLCVLFPCAFCPNAYDFSDPDNEGDVGECPGTDGPGRPNCMPAAWYIVTSVDDCINCPSQVSPPPEKFCSVTGTFNCCFDGPPTAICSAGECCGGPIGMVATNPGCADPTTFLYGPVYYGDCSTFVPADYAFLIGSCQVVACPSCGSGSAWYIVTGVVGCDDAVPGFPGYVFAVLSGTFSCCV